jgi:hypothetical protein
MFFTQENGILIQCMDACFGLVRKRCQGQIYGQPKHGTLMFADQDDVDNFVDNYSATATSVDEVTDYMYYTFMLFRYLIHLATSE